MDYIDRCLIILRPKEPFLVWLKSLPDPVDYTLEDLRSDAKAVLIPDFDGDEELDDFLSTHAVELFEAELEDWWTEKALWPKDRDEKLFQQWFDIEFHSTVADLVQEDYVEEAH